MTTLPKAPLIETIVEIRWGKVIKSPGKPVSFSFPHDDTDFFPGQFQAIAKKKGYTLIERPNKEAPLIPHLVKYRFRPSENTWPCYQIGLGILTINQTVEGYDWETFKESVMNGINMLDMGHPVGLSNLPAIGIEMRYQDGFLFEQNETSADFLRNKLEIELKFPDEFSSSPNLTDNVKGEFSVTIEASKPKGIVNINLLEGLINGKPGFIMDTIVRSVDEHKPRFESKILSQWLEEAHEIQRIVFKSLINPTYSKSFKET